MRDIQKLVDGLSGFTPGPWHRGQEGNTRIYGPDGQLENSGMLAEAKYKAVTANAALIAAAPDLHAAIVALLADKAKLRDALQSIRQYGSDTISGPVKSSDDTKSWVRGGVIEMTKRASAALEATT